MRLLSLTARGAPGLIVLAFGAVGGARASPPTDDPFAHIDCRKATVQMELNACAVREFRSWDTKLDALYRQLMAAADAKDRSLLKASEKDWISYRDSACALEAAGSEGGSIAPMEYANCQTEKTRTRIAELKRQDE